MNYLIPNYVVRGSHEEVTLINSMLAEKVIGQVDTEKVLLVFKYLFANTTQSNKVNFTLADMVCESGFIPRTSINNKFKAILMYLGCKGYIDDIDFANLRSNEFIKVTPNYFDVDEDGNKVNYFMISDIEVDKIMSIENVDNGKLLLYFATLKSRIYSNVKDGDNKAQVCYPSVLDMAKDIGISTDTITQYNTILEKENLIYRDNAGRFVKGIDNRQVFSKSNNTYTLTSITDYEKEVKKSIKAYRDNMKKLGWSLCEDTTITTRQIAGTINKLSAMKDLTDEQKCLLKDARAKQDVISSSAKYDNKELLDNNPDMLLSDLFLDKDMDSLAEKYQDIEESLGLVDEDFNLVVDHKYYSWIITEYDVREHNYYKNMVRRKIREIENQGKEENLNFIAKMGVDITEQEFSNMVDDLFG